MDAAIQPELKYCSECGRPTPPDDLARFGDRLVCPYCKNTFVQKLREGVAPAHAAFQYGGFWMRFVASLIDGIILAVVGTVVNFVAVGSMMPGMGNIRPDSTPEEAFAAIGPVLGMLGLAFLINTAIQCAYESLFISRVGATPGKMVFGMKVVRPDGRPVSLGRAVGRYFAKFLSAMTLMIGYIMAGFDSHKRAMHDMICDTRVIKTLD